MKYALLSVFDKTGIVELARDLVEQGYTILSSGGTHKKLSDASIKVQKVSDYTGYPEIMGGRVKTLHPKIHGGILGKRDKHFVDGIEWIDVVVVNLYPFEDTISKPQVTEAEAIEQIDIGGPTMLRAAAKNFNYVTVVCDPNDYSKLMSQLPEPELKFKKQMAIKAFEHTAHYDSVITKWLSKELKSDMKFDLSLHETLRYGENPHQKASVYVDTNFEETLTQHQGKQLSYNNMIDMEAAISAAICHDEPSCVIVKHANPCGAAIHPDGTSAAFTLALECDPVSSYGGIVAFNREVGIADVITIKKSRTFFEIICAPMFTSEALDALSVRKNLRVIEFNKSFSDNSLKIKRLMGRWLVQEQDEVKSTMWKNHTKRVPSFQQREEIKFAWKMCKFVKSNAVVMACSKDGGIMLCGVGAGQMSRVDSVNIALSKSKVEPEDCVMASDGFFPFPDGPMVAMDAGVKVFIQPGGSIRDNQVVEAVDSRNGIMVMTGVRHFNH